METNLHPSCNPAAPGIPRPGAADVNLNLDIQFSFITYNFTINNHSFIPPTAPVLLQILSGAQTAQALLPVGNVYPLPLNKVIEISIPGGSTGSPVSDSFFNMSNDPFLTSKQHPFHLHGVCPTSKKKNFSHLILIYSKLLALSEVQEVQSITL